jgi:23S rRNA (uracil1939-C5)-methyltransferase
LPGEQVRVRVVEEKRNILDAELIELMQPSPQRIDPGCVLFGRCGGCQLQMLNAPAQIAHKQSVLQRLLKPFANTIIWDDPITASPWSYRHRARLAVSDVNGQPYVGFKSANSHRVIAVPACPILDRRLQPLLEQLPGWLAQLPQWRRLEEVLIAVDADGQLALDWNTQRAFPKADAKQLQNLAQAAGVICGADAVLRYDVPSVQNSFEFSVRDFTQVNPAINNQLVARAIDWLAPTANDDIADLFCGLGNFTLPLARLSKWVIGYESSMVMVERARRAAAAGHCPNVEFQAKDLFGAHEPVPDSFDNPFDNRFDKVLLDPPRAGAKAVCEKLARANRLQRIVYVSCNPQTLVRDLEILVAGGFTVDRAALVDMFPQTGHCEAVVKLARL